MGLGPSGPRPAPRGPRGRGAPELDRVTVRQWLDSLGAGARLQRRLLDPIALGVLNDDPGIAAATGLAQAMADMFYRGAQGSRLGLSTVGLSELYTGGAEIHRGTGRAGHRVAPGGRVHQGKRPCRRDRLGGRDSGPGPGRGVHLAPVGFTPPGSARGRAALGKLGPLRS